MKKTPKILFACFAILLLTVFGCNYVRLQARMDRILRNNPYCCGVRVSVHYGNYVDPGVLVFDLLSFPETDRFTAVFFTLLQFAESEYPDRYERVELSYRGRLKFILDGDYFRQLGNENACCDPVSVMCAFPANLKDGTLQPAYPERKGGRIAAAKAQLKDYYDFLGRWYMRDRID